jgi:hypothetical protein
VAAHALPVEVPGVVVKWVLRQHPGPLGCGIGDLHDRDLGVRLVAVPVRLGGERRDIDQRSLVVGVGNQRVGVRAAIRSHRRDEEGGAGIGDVEQADPLEAGGPGQLVLAGASFVGLRVIDGLSQDQAIPGLVDGHVALRPATEERGQQPRVRGVRDVVDPKPAVVPREDQVSPEGQVRVHRGPGASGLVHHVTAPGPSEPLPRRGKASGHRGQHRRGDGRDSDQSTDRNASHGQG